MKRSEPLVSDPDKTRAWQQRSREKAAQNARDRPRTALNGAAPKDHNAEGKPLGPVRFRAPHPARDELCPTCLLQGVKRPAASWHHWLPQQQIRVYVRGLRLPDRPSRRRLGHLLGDRRNLTAFCEDHHGSHGTRSHDFVRAQVPDSAFEFAMELGQEWAERLVRMYPVRRK